MRSGIGSGRFRFAPNGRLDAVWPDTRYAANNTGSQLFYYSSTNTGVTWARKRPGKHIIQSIPRISESEQDRRLHHDGFG